MVVVPVTNMTKGCAHNALNSGCCVTCNTASTAGVIIVPHACTMLLVRGLIELTT